MAEQYCHSRIDLRLHGALVAARPVDVSVFRTGLDDGPAADGGRQYADPVLAAATTIVSLADDRYGRQCGDRRDTDLRTTVALLRQHLFLCEDDDDARRGRQCLGVSSERVPHGQ